MIKKRPSPFRSSVKFFRLPLAAVLLIGILLSCSSDLSEIRHEADPENYSGEPGSASPDPYTLTRDPYAPDQDQSVAGSPDHALSRAVAPSSRAVPAITLAYGTRQVFRYRHADINILGNVSSSAALSSARYSLNGGPGTSFYVRGMDRQRDRLSRNRLAGNPGDFNIEIPVSSPDLRGGRNALRITVTDGTNGVSVLNLNFTWDRRSVRLPLDLTDLSGYAGIQQIGQVVDGRFEFDPESGVIRTTAPVARDALFLIGSPYGSQEAEYKVRFTGRSGSFVGLSDFFVSHDALTPDIGIKPGYSTAGLATVRGGSSSRTAQIWLAVSDLVQDSSHWVVATDPRARFVYDLNRTYRVRHQVLFEDGVNRSRFRIWPDGAAEPSAWTADESDAGIPDSMRKHASGSFGLFQYDGTPTEWFEIRVTALD